MIGWASTTSNSCCQICLPGTPATVCFNDLDVSCHSKNGNGDYDFFMFDQIWRPQFCQSLANGHDPTLTHMTGSMCEKYTTSDSLLSIHGLWPNYWNGYPQCCNETQNNFALVPEEVTQWNIYPEIMKQWADPTDSSSCSVCLMLNHEWLKHGACYSPGDPEHYFSDALNIGSVLTMLTKQINYLNGTTVLTEDVQKLYSVAVNVMCDPHDAASTSSTGYFLELQTCWSRARDPIDCPPPATTSATAPCPEFTVFRV